MRNALKLAQINVLFDDIVYLSESDKRIVY